MADEDQYGISQSGLVARSPEGHAARGMQIKGNEDVWIEIQAHTFKNWVNEKLAPSGLLVEDLVEDLRDGVCLVTLVEILQQKKLRKISRPMNQHQWLENVTTALRAIEQDGIKLVNIGESLLPRQRRHVHPSPCAVGSGVLHVLHDSESRYKRPSRVVDTSPTILQRDVIIAGLARVSLHRKIYWGSAHEHR